MYIWNTTITFSVFKAGLFAACFCVKKQVHTRMDPWVCGSIPQHSMYATYAYIGVVGITATTDVIPRSPLDLLFWWSTAAATRSSWALPLTCIGSCSPATLEPKTPVHFIFSLAHPKVQALPRNNHLTPASFFSSLGLEDCLRYLKGPSMDCDLKRLAALRGNMKKRKWWSSCFIPFLVCSPKSFV